MVLRRAHEDGVNRPLSMTRLSSLPAGLPVVSEDPPRDLSVVEEETLEDLAEAEDNREEDSSAGLEAEVASALGGPEGEQATLPPPPLSNPRDQQVAGSLLSPHRDQYAARRRFMHRWQRHY